MPALARLHRPTPLSRPGLIALAAAAACLAAGPAAAQSAASAEPTAPAAGTPAAELQTVTVTATRRAESLQTVPVAVSVISGQALEDANRNTLGALATQVPSINFRTGASNKDTSLFVRGVGTISTSPGVEPTVATVIDGVVLARPGQATLDLLDIDRVEVLRGPQGTLFGKNASAGVVNIISRAPAASTERYIDFSHYGAGNENRLRGGISGELAPGWRGSFNALVGQFDGNVTNVANGEQVNGYDKRGARARLEYSTSPDLKLTLSADTLHSVDSIPTGVVTRTSLIAYPSGAVSSFPAFAAALGPVVASDDNRQINSNLKTEVRDHNSGVSGTVEARLGEHQLTSITAWRRWANSQVQDGDRLSAAVVGLPQSHDHGEVDFEQLSQELRLASPRADGRNRSLDYVAGLYHLHSHNDETYRRDVLRVLASGAQYADWGLAQYGTRSNSTALFGEGRWHFSPTLRSIGGLRWTQDQLSFDHSRIRSTPDAVFAGAVPGVNAPVANSGGTRNTGVSGRVGPQWDISPELTSYATYSRGYKGPAFNVFFNMLDRDTLALAPETSNSVELGAKYQSADKRLRTNLAVFSTQYRNYQANFFDTVGGAVVTRLINAGQVSSQGIELDVAAKPVPQLTLNAALAHIRARIDRFNCPAGAAASCLVDGKPLPFSPDWKLAAGASWRQTLAQGYVLDLGTDLNWQSRVQYDISQFADTIQGAYGIVNASATLSKPAQGWRVALVVKNLGDKSYASFLGRGGSYVNRWVPRDDQRTVGLNLHLDF